MVISAPAAALGSVSRVYGKSGKAWPTFRNLGKILKNDYHMADNGNF